MRSLKNRNWLGVMLIALILLSGTTVSALAAGYTDRYQEGRKLFVSGKYTRAIRHFRQMLADDRTSDLSDNCQYWIGEAYYQLGDYAQAAVEFDKTLTFPSTNKREDALFKIAQCHERLGELELAQQLYKRFLAEYPESRHSRSVLTKLETLGAL
jgi:tol-pal system protein YbgF